MGVMGVGNENLGVAKSDDNAERAATERSSGYDKAVLGDVETAGPKNIVRIHLFLFILVFYKHTLTIY